MGRLCFQVDLDIMGPENSMRQDFIELGQQAFPWSVNGSNGPANGAVTLPVGLHMLELDALLGPGSILALHSFLEALAFSVYHGHDSADRACLYFESSSVDSPSSSSSRLPVRPPRENCRTWVN